MSKYWRGFHKLKPVGFGLALGLALFILFVANRQTPERIDSNQAALPVQIITAERLPFLIEAAGHGVVRPTEIWRATANVAGRVVERNAALESGSMIPAGELLVALDPSRYTLAIADAQAEIQSVLAEQEKLAIEQTSTQQIVALEQGRLQLAEQELSRQQRLADIGTVSQTRLDEQLRATIGQRQAVAQLQNALAQIPAQQRLLQARHERAKVRLAQAERDLSDTHFVAPYDLRIGDVHVQLHQFVSVGQLLFQADNIATAEVEARIPFTLLSRLLGVALNVVPAETLSLVERMDLGSLNANVDLIGATGVSWSGRVVRVARGLEPQTRAVRVVVRVDKPYENISLPSKPALQPGMYTRVTIAAPTTQSLLVIPARAVHQGEVWLVSSTQQLERRSVQVAFEQRGLAVITAGLKAGEQVTIDDLPHALQGLPVEASLAEALQQDMSRMAAGAPL